MSKSRGTGISPLRYLDVGMNPEWLRYYIAAKLNANVEDLDFNPEDFIARVNSDLVGKYVNIASRAANFITRHFGGELRYSGDTERLADLAQAHAALLQQSYENREFGKAMRDIMALADRINQDFDARQPWVLARDPAKAAELQDVCSRALHGFKLLSVLLAPVLPQVAARVAQQFFGLDRTFRWSDAAVLPGRVNPYQHLMTRVDAKQLDALFETARTAADAGPGPCCGAARPRRRTRLRQTPQPLDRRVPQDRSARGAHRRGGDGRGRRQAAEAHARSRLGDAHGVRRHQVEPTIPPH